MPHRIRLTSAQLAALRSARTYGDPTRHLRGQSEWGGWQRTRGALVRFGYIDGEGAITERGKDAVARYDSVL